jgi:DNA polymerase-3 subunit epsilon
MTWHLEPMAAFDLETTGVDPETARIVTATIARIDALAGAPVQTEQWLVNPGVEIPAAATAIHGVTTEKAQADGVDPATACARIFAELDQVWTGGRPVVIYNAPYDLTVLDRELRRHCGVNLDGVIGPVIDPFVIDKHVDPYRRGSRTLTATCGHYGAALTDAHTATGDALAAARLAWRAEWATDFADYLRRQGKPEDIDGSWPLRPWRTDQAAPDTEGTTAA